MKSALVHPVGVLTAAGVIILLLWKVVPIFATLFAVWEFRCRCRRESHGFERLMEVGLILFLIRFVGILVALKTGTELRVAAWRWTRSS